MTPPPRPPRPSSVFSSDPGRPEPDVGQGKPPGLGRWRDWLLGAALLLALVVVVEQMVGWRELLDPWRSIPAGLLFGAFLLTALSYLLRAVRVRDYFQDVVGGRFPTLLRLSVLHTTANNLLPMRAGEVVFPWLMRRYFGQGFLVSGVSLVWIRLLDLHSLVLGGLIVLWLRDPSWWWPLLALFWLALVPMGLLLRRARWPQALMPGRLRSVLLFVLDAAPSSAPLLARLYLWTLLCWGAKLLGFALVLGYFVDAPLWQVLAGVLGAELSSVLPFHGIAGAGSYELAGMAALVPLGVGVEAALAGAVNLHLFLLGTTLMLGALALLLPPGRPPRGPPRGLPAPS